MTARYSPVDVIETISHIFFGRICASNSSSFFSHALELSLKQQMKQSVEWRGLSKEYWMRSSPKKMCNYVIFVVNTCIT